MGYARVDVEGIEPTSDPWDHLIYSQNLCHTGLNVRLKVGSPGRIRTYILAVNSRPSFQLHHRGTNLVGPLGFEPSLNRLKGEGAFRYTTGPYEAGWRPAFRRPGDKGKTKPPEKVSILISSPGRPTRLELVPRISQIRMLTSYTLAAIKLARVAPAPSTIRILSKNYRNFCGPRENRTLASRLQGGRATTITISPCLQQLPNLRMGEESNPDPCESLRLSKPATVLRWTHPCGERST